MDQQFEKLAARFIDEYPALSPVGATTLGDHRFDEELDQFTESSRNKQREFYRAYLAELDKIDRAKLSRGHQVDFELLNLQLRQDLWSLDEIQEWAWNPVVSTQVAGSAIYGLVARDFAPIEKRLISVTARLEKLPKFYAQIRATLVPKRVPSVHAETAVKQNRGVLNTVDSLVKPHLDKLAAPERERLVKAIAIATAAVDEQQKWLKEDLVPKAGGDFRLGPKLFDQKLAFALGTSLSRGEIRDRAEFELRRVRSEMYKIARSVLKETSTPDEPSPEVQQRIIAAALEKANVDIPPRDGVVAAARKSLVVATEFVRKKDLVTIPPDPVDIIIMPEFQRGVSVAYCDSPGALEVGQKTFYAVAPLPDDWTEKQCTSFLREYNIRSIHNLTVHEAMPGHFLQLAHANRNPNRLRSLLSSGTFVEGWACYTEQLMPEQGFLDNDPLMKLVVLKWYLRSISNALLDQSIHVDGMSREDAMKLMTEDAFQEEREAAGKWVRAQLTSSQLSTYFIGLQEHLDLRAAATKAWGKEFSLKRYHDAVLSFGSPGAKFVRALLLNEAIPDNRGRFLPAM